jgi:hypothetical protein
MLLFDLPQISQMTQIFDFTFNILETILTQHIFNAKFSLFRLLILVS